MRGFLFSSGVAVAVACGGGGGGGSPDASTQQDASLPPPPSTVCDVPAKAVDTSTPTTVVSDCSSDAAFRAAVATGGIVTFACGTATIVVSSEVPVAKDTTIDGGGKITLSGGGKSRILHITSAWNVSTPLLTVQNLTFEGGFTSDVANTTSTKQGGGAIFEDGGSLTYDGAHVSLALCGDSFTGNKANAAGGAVFRVGYNDQGGAPSVVTIDRSTFDGNTVGDANAGNAAGLYLENVQLTITNTTISNNTGHYGGGLWAGQSDILDLQNVTIANNTASGGGGIWFANQVTGTLLNCTIAGNTGDGLFGGDTGVALKDSIIANNVRGTLDSTTNCAKQHASGAPDIQFPSTGGVMCTSDVTVADPLLGPLQDNGGPVKTMKPGSGSPAIGAGQSCSPTDATGATRPSACTLGAIEAK